MRFLRRSLMGVFLAAMTSALIVMAGLTVWSALQASWAEGPPAREAEEQVFAANVVTVESRRLVPVLETFGQIQSTRTLEIRARVGGTVVSLSEAFEEGGEVAAGETIARIDPAEAEAALAVAEADLAEAEVDLREARRNLELADADLAAAEMQAELRRTAQTRQQDLSDRGVGSAAAVETAELAQAAAEQAVLSRRLALAQAETAIERAETALSRRRIDLGEAQRQLDRTEIRAEFDGILSEVSVVEGGLVAANERLALLVDPAALEVAFRLSTAQYRRLLDNDGRLIPAEVEVSLDVLGLDMVATGRISRASATVAEGQSGRLIYARLGDAPAFRPGDFVTVAIEELALEEVAILPAAAVDSAGTVLALTPEDRLEILPAVVVRRQGDDVIVDAAAIGGRRVVAERTPLLGAGIKVVPSQRGAPDLGAEPPEMIELSDARRTALVAFVEGSDGMPSEAKARVLAQLRETQVPAQVVARIEQRMGG